MKTLKLILGLVILITLNSCCNDDNEIIVTEKIIQKDLVMDFQDNVIRIDGSWLQNSNYDLNNWEYYQDFGCQRKDGFVFIYANPTKYEIVDAKIINYPGTWYLSQDYDNSFYFEGPDLIEWTNNWEIMYFQITVKEIN